MHEEQQPRYRQPFALTTLMLNNAQLGGQISTKNHAGGGNLLWLHYNDCNSSHCSTSGMQSSFTVLWSAVETTLNQVPALPEIIIYCWGCRIKLEGRLQACNSWIELHSGKHCLIVSVVLFPHSAHLSPCQALNTTMFLHIASMQSLIQTSTKQPWSRFEPSPHDQLLYEGCIHAGDQDLCVFNILIQPLHIYHSLMALVVWASILV